MKYYGIEICRFCGVNVKSDAPVVLPEFIVRMAESIKSFIVNADAVDVESFICVMNKANENNLKVIYEINEIETFTANIENDRNIIPLVEMNDFNIN